MFLGAVQLSQMSDFAMSINVLSYDVAAHCGRGWVSSAGHEDDHLSARELSNKGVF